MKHDAAWSHLTAWRSVFNFFALHLEEYFSSPILQDQRMCFRPAIAFAQRSQWNDQLRVMTVAACSRVVLKYVEVTSEETPVVPKTQASSARLLIQFIGLMLAIWVGSIQEKLVWQTTKGKQGQCQASWCKSQVYSSMEKTCISLHIPFSTCILHRLDKNLKIL